jgi:hypothetical protein
MKDNKDICDTFGETSAGGGDSAVFVDMDYHRELTQGCPAHPSQ